MATTGSTGSTPNPETAVMRLGARLRRVRLARGMTQTEVANHQYSVSYISAVERGQIRPSLGALETLAARLEVPLDQLLRDDDDEEEPASSRPTSGRGARAPGALVREEVDTHLRAAEVLAHRRDPAAALALLEALQRPHPPLTPLAPVEQADWYRLVGTAHLALGHAEEALHALQAGLSVADQAGDRALWAQLHLALGDAYRVSGQPQRALGSYEEALDVIGRGAAVDPDTHLAVLAGLGATCAHLGEIDAARGHLEQAVQLAHELLDPARAAVCYWELQSTVRAQGDQRRAWRYATRGAELSEAAERQRLTTRVYARLGFAHLHRRQADQARAALETAHERAERHGDLRVLAEAERGLALVSLDQERVDAAAEAANRALEYAQTLGDSVARGEALLVAARVCDARGDAEGAQRGFDEAGVLLEGAGDAAVGELGEAYRRYAHFLEQHGDSAGALDLLRKAWGLRERAV